MRTTAIAAVALLGLQLVLPVSAPAQTSGWNFSGKTPAPTAAAAPKKAAAPRKPAVAKTAVVAKRKTPASRPASAAVIVASGRPAKSPETVPQVVASGALLCVPSTGTAPLASVQLPVERAIASSAGTATPIANVPATGPLVAAALAVASTVAITAQATKPIEPQTPQPTGLERLSDEWPKAIKVGVQYRGRVEGQRGSSVTNGRDDGYYLNRIRLESTVTATPWLKGFAQVQDAQTLGYNLAAQPTSLTNTLDLRQSYLEARWPAATGFGVRAGRQELSFGDQRLVGAADWLNTARSFDAVRVFMTRPGVQVDAFVSSVVVIAQNAFDRRSPGEIFSGTYVSLSHLMPKGVVEPYVLARSQTRVTGELGDVADGATYTFGARAAGALPHQFSYGVEAAAQRGHLAADTIGAWAGHYAMAWALVPSPIKMRLVAEFNHASGDSNPRDGRRGTFDQLYPTNHTKYGIADQMGWRNMRDVMAGVEVTPLAKLKLNADVHRLFLATTADGLYTAAGARRVLNRQAASRTVGTEIDLQSAYAFSKELSLSAGVGTLFTGDYLAQSTAAGTLLMPYVMWNIKF